MKKEVEIVVTCQVTHIVRVEEEDAAAMEKLSAEKRRELEKALEKDLNSDKVDVTDYKAFIRDAKEGDGDDE